MKLLADARGLAFAGQGESILRRGRRRTPVLWKNERYDQTGKGVDRVSEEKATDKKKISQPHTKGEVKIIK